MSAITLTLSPREHEARFWESPGMLRSARFSDQLGAAFLVVTNCLYLRWHAQMGAGWDVAMWCGVLLATSILPVAWLLAAPQSYLRLRSRVLLCNRVLRLGHAGWLVWRTRVQHDGKPLALLKTLSRTPLAGGPLRPPLEALRLAVHATGASLALFHGAVMPLPFLLQLPLHLGYLALTVAYNHPVARYLLQHLLHPGHLTALCTALNWGLEVLTVTSLGATPSARRMNQQCEQHALDMLLVFTAVYVGAAVPVYVAYLLERQQKQAYLELLHGGQVHQLPWEREWNWDRAKEAVASRLGAVLWQLVYLTAMAVECWLAAALFSPYLPHVVVPVATL